MGKHCMAKQILATGSLQDKLTENIYLGINCFMVCIPRFSLHLPILLAVMVFPANGMER
jgi:hypothetical protein